MGCEGPSGGGESGGVVREGLRAETGEKAEGTVEEGNQGCGDEAAKSGGRRGEVGEDPQSTGGGGGCEAGGEGGDFGGGQAVEEEVGGDQVD